MLQIIWLVMFMCKRMACANNMDQMGLEGKVLIIHQSFTVSLVFELKSAELSYFIYLFICVFFFPRTPRHVVTMKFIATYDKTTVGSGHKK